MRGADRCTDAVLDRSTFLALLNLLNTDNRNVKEKALAALSCAAAAPVFQEYLLEIDGVAHLLQFIEENTDSMLLHKALSVLLDLCNSKAKDSST